ncbi:MAG: L-histidine N(alpha)-methyltransferase [Alphaproteobacteria bacterium]
MKWKPTSVEMNFLSACEELLATRRALNVIDYAYITPSNSSEGEADGSALWEKLAALGASSTYKISQNEKLLITETIAPHLANYVEDVGCFIDAGPGLLDSLSQKTMPTLRALLKKDLALDIPEKDRMSYVAVDMHQPIALHATSAVCSYFPRHVRPGPVAADFAQQGRFIDRTNRKNNWGRSLIVMYGITAGQFPLSTSTDGPAKSTIIGAPHREGRISLKTLLGYMKERVDHDGYMLFTVDTEKDPRRAVETYRGQLVEDFTQNVWHMAAKLANNPQNGRTFDPARMFYRATWNEEFSAVGHVYRTEVNQAIILNGRLSRDEPQRIMADQAYLGGISVKCSEGRVTDEARQAGWDVVHVFQQSNNTIKGILLQAKPG